MGTEWWPQLHKAREAFVEVDAACSWTSLEDQCNTQRCGGEGSLMFQRNNKGTSYRRCGSQEARPTRSKFIWRDQQEWNVPT